jgi:transcriptional regulator GlxA family with amidase domain
MAFMRVLSTIYEKYNEKLTISDLAKQANLSRSMFIQKFKEICKMSPGEYILERRLDVAQYMLLNTGHSLSEIAFRTGFYDSAHFSRLFFKKNGISPSLYRKNNVKY